MFKYSIPLVPNGVSWWVINISDRTIITFILGKAFNGIYAVSNKFPTIISSLLGIFNLSWSESSALHIDDKDRDISAPTPFKGKTHKEKGKVVATPEIDQYGNLPNQYRRFEKAKKLDEEAAYSSISYGSFQIMGSNYKDAGYKSAKEFGDAMFSADEDKIMIGLHLHVSIMVLVIKITNMIPKWLKIIRSFQRIHLRDTKNLKLKYPQDNLN